MIQRIASRRTSTQRAVAAEPNARILDRTRLAATLTKSVYEQIKADVLTGRLRPGEKLGAEVLRKRFNTGSSPVREALNRLLSEGFVALEEQKGFRVAPVSREELKELVAARCWIDGIAVRESVRNFSARWEENLVLALHRLSRTSRREQNPAVADNWESRHKTFHLALVGGCENDWIERISEQLLDAAERYRRLVADQTPERNELEEHRAIVDACFERNADRAVELLKQHYGRTYNIVDNSLIQAGQIIPRKK